ncbi:MAG: DUF58 domain-containing protein [Pseudomonadota bacterium]|nr:DUF58 domain-containing protein [Gammaproteobacteria bacterium]MBJ53770.1 DUF58 domain-containing protein [Gammaproteobacteria bacterium]MBJ54670.1 DUF58 domain-containing protein [Gammaproteobacteria bacterium]MEC8859264.1 DUF58 domain-containing protein [Pseudomonadota bacterium]|tara:strand:- start:1209 stop:2105 length:897 start_codon:yes stop_codon:yes gene_type:complete
MTQSNNFIDPAVLATLDNLEMRARVVVEGFIAGLHKSPKRGFSVEFTDYRHYIRGDDMRHVDWKLYGRTDKLYIKQYEDETNVRCYLLLDSSASMSYASPGMMSKLEYGRTLASALAYFIMRQKDAVGLITFDDHIRDYIPARARQLHLIRILRKLNELQAGKTTNIVRPLTELAMSLNSKSLVILISDMLEDEEGTIKALQQLRAMGNEVIVFHVLDDQELNFNFKESTEFVDMESAETHRTSPAAVRNAYLENLNNYLTECRKRCQSSGVDYCLLNTSQPLDKALASYLARRARSA